MKTVFPQIISNTDLALWSNCELKWFRMRCQLLKKYRFNIDLTAGSAFAKAIEMARKAYYIEKVDPYDAVEDAAEYVLEHLHEQEFQDKLKSPERMALAVKDYFREFPLEDAEVVPIKLASGTCAIENNMVIELPIKHPTLGVPLLFKAKLDMLGEYMTRNYIVDEKTCKQLNSNEAALLATSGQFVGYAWAARELGVKIQGALVRKVAIQIAGNKIVQIEIPITEYMIDMWYQSLLSKVTVMVEKYNDFLMGTDFKRAFILDYQNGCTSYFKPCPFQEGCASKHGEAFIKTEFKQVAWDAENRVEVSIDDYIKMLES